MRLLDINKSLVLFMIFPLTSHSLSLNQGLTILDQSFDKDTSNRGPCNLILLTRVEDYFYVANRGYYTLSSANLLDAKEYFTKSDSHCLILVASGKVEMKDLIHHGQKIQMIKPVAVLLIDIPKWLDLSTKSQTLDISFPVLILTSDLNGNFSQIVAMHIVKLSKKLIFFSKRYPLLSLCIQETKVLEDVYCKFRCDTMSQCPRSAEEL